MKRRLKEILPEIKDFYTIDEFGTVYSDNLSGYPLKHRISNQGYHRVALSQDDGTQKEYSVHRLVMMAFAPIENYEKLQVNHIDGNKSNNSLINLEWCTASQNQKHAYDHGLNHLSNQWGESNYQAKLTQADIDKIFELRRRGLTQQAIANQFNVSRRHIGKILQGQRWNKNNSNQG